MSHRRGRREEIKRFRDGQNPEVSTLTILPNIPREKKEEYLKYMLLFSLIISKEEMGLVDCNHIMGLVTK